jgi:hypothetical protein
MKHELMKIVIQRLMLPVELMKSGILLISLNVFNGVKSECFKTVFIMILKVLIFSERKIGV